jgi:hypothetical protein
MGAPDFATIGGIVAATIVLVEALKRGIGNLPYARAVPTWIYAVAIAAILTALARFLFDTLPGPFWPLMLQAITNAAAASGFYSWLTDTTKPLQMSEAAIQARLRAQAVEEDARDREVQGFDKLSSLAMVLGAGLLLSLLAGCQTVPDPYWNADRQTYEAVAPEYKAYVEADAGLPVEQKARRQRTLDTWKLRVDQAARASSEAAATQASK